MMPMPIFIPSSSGSCDASAGQKIFLDINKNFERIKSRIESVVWRVYRDDAYVKSNGLWIDKDIRIHETSGFVATCSFTIFMTAVLFLMNHSSWHENNFFNEIWDWFFYYANDDLLLGILLFSAIMILSFIVSGLIVGRIVKIEKERIKRLEITENTNNTIISFTVDDNIDYEFYKGLVKEFKIGVKKDRY